jgi:hypothetical protein
MLLGYWSWVFRRCRPKGFDDKATPFAHVNDVKERAPSLQITLSVGAREGLRYSRLGLEDGGFSADVSSLAEGG